MSPFKKNTTLPHMQCKYLIAQSSPRLHPVSFKIALVNSTYPFAVSTKYITASINVNKHSFNRLIKNKKNKTFYFTLKIFFFPLTRNKCWRGCGEAGALPGRRCARRLEQPLRETVRRPLEELNGALPCGPAIPPVGISQRNWKNIYL